MRPTGRSLFLALAFLGIGIAAVPVLAQPKERDHRDKGGEKDKDKGDKDKDKKGPDVRDHRGDGKQPPPKVEISVTGFAPQKGKVGTQVVISGAGFVKQDKVLVGGRPVNGATITETSITFTFPARYYDGTIMVRHPGAANDIMVGKFTVEEDPNIVSFAPASGPVGTKVEIKGSGFAAGDQVLFNGKAIAPSEFGPDRIVVSIPAGAQTDFFTVQRPNGASSKSKRAFTVVLPAPAIASFSPTSGPPGTKVRIVGTNFAAEDKVYFGRMMLPPDARTETTLDVTIPQNAKQSDVFVVRGPRGEARSATPFTVVLNPLVTRFNPMFGAPGTRVEIFGDHFMQGDEVRLNGRAIKIVALEEKRITVEIPQGAKTDTFLVFRGGVQVAAAKQPFEVTGAPTVASFTPAGGPVGTRVTITGTNFSGDAKVMYGAQQIRIVNRGGDTTLEVIIPNGATSQPFVVETRGGQATSRASFQVYTYSAITGIAPVSGPVGTRLTIRGSNFNGNEAFYLNGASLPVVEKTAAQYVVTIPAGASTGKIEWQSYDKRQTSRYTFTVVQPPTLAGFTPESGPPGTQVTLTGTNFTNGTAVFYGSLPCQIVRRSLPTQLLVTIPANASGTDYLWVDDGGVRIKSAKTFQVVAPPVISSFTPASGPVGSQVTIAGANFTNTTTVLFDNVAATIVKRNLPSQIVVQIPRNVPAGAVWVWIEDRGQKVRSTTQFQVVVMPAIASISPLSGPVGTKVTISGENFGANATVWFGTISCPIVKRTGRTQLIVEIPQGAKGKQALVIDDGGNKVTSKDVFEVIEAPQPPANDDGAGHHEHAHQHPHEAGDHHHHPHAHPHRPGTNHHHPY